MENFEIMYFGVSLKHFLDQHFSTFFRKTSHGCLNHMVLCMESLGRLKNLDPGTDFIYITRHLERELDQPDNGKNIDEIIVLNKCISLLFPLICLNCFVCFFSIIASLPFENRSLYMILSKAFSVLRPPLRTKLATTFS